MSKQDLVNFLEHAYDGANKQEITSKFIGAYETRSKIAKENNLLSKDKEMSQDSQAPVTPPAVEAPKETNPEYVTRQEIFEALTPILETIKSIDSRMGGIEKSLETGDLNKLFKRQPTLSEMLAAQLGGVSKETHATQAPDPASLGGPDITKAQQVDSQGQFAIPIFNDIVSGKFDKPRQ